MNVKALKFTSEFLIELLRRDPSLSSSLPVDAELVDIKFDLLSQEVLAFVRSDSLIETASSESAFEKQEVASSAKDEGMQCTSVAKLTPCRIAERLQNELVSKYGKLLSFSVKSNNLIAYPVYPLGVERGEIDAFVKNCGGRWIEAEVSSYWEIPLM
jgi:hypothetical protein